MVIFLHVLCWFLAYSLPGVVVGAVAYNCYPKKGTPYSIEDLILIASSIFWPIAVIPVIAFALASRPERRAKAEAVRQKEIVMADRLVREFSANQRPKVL